MIFKRPENLSYSDMCIYIDTHVYTDSCDQQLVYEYLYHISFMLTRKYKIFEKFSDCEPFALWFATELYNRLFDKRQLGEQPKLKKIKSILNYAKHVLYPLACNYRKLGFNSTTKIEQDYQYSPTETALRSEYIDIDVENYLQQISSVIKTKLKQHLFYKDLIEYKNLLISCYLTLLDQITLPSYIQVQSIEDNTEFLAKQFSEESMNKVILYDLDKSYTNLIKLVINKTKKQIIKDIRYIAYIHNEPQELVSYMFFEHAKDILGQEEQL